MSQPNWFRTCVGCGKARHKKELLRIVKYRDNSLEFDHEQKKQGRGAYICPTIDCAILAKNSRGFNRSFHTEIESSFYEKLIQQVKQIEY